MSLRGFKKKDERKEQTPNILGAEGRFGVTTCTPGVVANAVILKTGRARKEEDLMIMV